MTEHYDQAQADQDDQMIVADEVAEITEEQMASVNTTNTVMIDAQGNTGYVDANGQFVILNSPVKTTSTPTVVNTSHTGAAPKPSIQLINTAVEIVDRLIKESGLEVQHVPIAELLERYDPRADTASIAKPEDAFFKDMIDAFYWVARSFKYAKLLGIKIPDAIRLMPQMDDKGRLTSYPVSIPLDVEERVDTCGSENMAKFIRSFRDGVKPILMQKFNTEFDKKYPSKPTMELFDGKIIRNKETDFMYIVNDIDDTAKLVKMTEVEYNSDAQSYVPTTCNLSVPFDVFAQECEICDNSPTITAKEE